MLNYIIKSGTRSLWKNKVTLGIGIFGFSVGLFACIILGLWVNKQYRYNDYISDSEGVCELLTSYSINGSMVTVAATSMPIIQAIEQAIPEIQEVAFLQLVKGDYALRIDDTPIKARGMGSSPNVFNVIPTRIIYGAPGELLNHPTSVVISESLAKQIFGNQFLSVLDSKELQVGEGKILEITGVFADLPEESTVQFDYLILAQNIEDHIGNFNNKTFVKIGLSDVKSVEEKINSQLKGKTESQVLLQPFRDTYLYSRFEDGKAVGGRIDYVHLFLLASSFIFLMALLNFVNLFVSNSLERTKSFGFRRIIGEGRGVQMGQLILESSLISFVSLSIALTGVYVALPLANKTFGGDLELPLTSISYWVAILVLFVMTGILSGLYPALVLTTSSPVGVVNQSKVSVGGAKLRRGFLVVQFFVSLLLVFFSYGVSRQLNFLMEKDLGYNKENVLCYALPKSVIGKTDVFRNSLSEAPFISNVAFCSSNLLTGGPMVGGANWPGKDPLDSTQFGVLFADNQFLPTMDIKLISGTFSRRENSATVPVIINRIAAKRMDGVEKILNQNITIWGTNCVVTGIMEDFHFNDLFSPIEPLVIANIPSDFEFLLARVQPGHEQEATAKLVETHRKYQPEDFPTYYWLDERIDNIYQNEVIMNRLAMVFSILSLIISFLGIFALTKFSAQARVKEFAIRKTLGATSMQVIGLMIWEYLTLTAISLFLALPIAYYLLARWLEKFAYTGSLLGTSVLALLLGIFTLVVLTVFFQALKVATTSPCRHLRTN
jgi:ABC-type antimicrobial peptide transport system permease subunit